MDIGSPLLSGVETVQKETTQPKTRMCCCVLGPWKLVYLQGRLFIVAVDHSSLNWVFKPLKTQHQTTRRSLRLQDFTFNIRFQTKDP